MTATHRMTIETDNGDEVLLACPEEACGRRLVLKRSGGMVVLNRGDFFATHAAGTLDLNVAAGAGNAGGAGGEAA